MRRWGKSNPFSEGHRRSLPPNHCLFDIDGINISIDKITIHEEKYRMELRNGSNFIESFHDEKNTQASFLKKFSHGSDVWVSEKETDSWWFLSRGILEKREKPGIIFEKTEDLLYVQTLINHRSHRLISVILRTEGIKQNPLEVIADTISEEYNIPKVLVNDTHKDSSVYFSKGGDILESQINDKFEGDWRKIWKRFKIF